jgi:hypothetical protein
MGARPPNRALSATRASGAGGRGVQTAGLAEQALADAQGSLRGGKPFTRNSLHQLLTNVVYCGQIRYRQEIHSGEHPAIVDPSLWQQVQRLLRVKRLRQGARLGNGALLLRTTALVAMKFRKARSCLPSRRPPVAAAN